MRIYIPTYGRSENLQHSTYHKIPAALRKYVRLVVQAREQEKYAGYPTLVLPEHIQTIAPTRQWILDNHSVRSSKYLVMLDDDLRFDKRRVDDKTKFTPATELDTLHMFDALRAALATHAHAGVMSREGGNRHAQNQTATRMTRVLAYDVLTYRNLNIRFDRVSTMEDFDVTLQLLRAGYPNLVLAGWVQDQGSSGARGGCSAFRTLELQAANAYKLADLHKPHVKCVQKTTKTAWDGATRTDVIVQWRRAYESSKR